MRSITGCSFKGKERKGGFGKITGYMVDFVEGCACFASFFAKQALDYGGKKV